MVPYSITSKINPAIGSCVYKLFYDNRYIIVKAKNMEQSAEQIQKKLNQVVRNTTVMQNDDLYYHFITYIEKHPEREFSHELILESEDPYKLLQAEQLELEKARKDPHCLNNNWDAYIPQYKQETKSYGWMPAGKVKRFLKWKKDKKRKKAAK